MARITKEQIEKAIAPFFVGSEYRIEFEESDQLVVFTVFNGRNVCMEFAENLESPFHEINLAVRTSIVFPDCPIYIAGIMIWIDHEFSLEKMSYEYLRKAALEYFELKLEELNQQGADESKEVLQIVLDITIQRTIEAIGYCRDFVAEEM